MNGKILNHCPRHTCLESSRRRVGPIHSATHSRLQKNLVIAKNVVEMFDAALMPQELEDAQKGCPARYRERRGEAYASVR